MGILFIKYKKKVRTQLRKIKSLKINYDQFKTILKFLKFLRNKLKQK